MEGTRVDLGGTPTLTACDDCMACSEVCPEPQVLPLALKGAGDGRPPVILSAECTNCARCLDICGKNVFKLGLRTNVEELSGLQSGPGNCAGKAA